MDNKTLVERLAGRLDITAEEVGALVDALSVAVGRSAVELDSVQVPSFGTFEPKRRMERLAVHPSSGRRLLVPPKIVLGFRPSAILKQKVDNAE